MEKRKKMARAAILAATIVGGVLMFAQPFEAQAYSGSCSTCLDGKRGLDSHGLTTCDKRGSECMRR